MGDVVGGRRASRAEAEGEGGPAAASASMCSSRSADVERCAAAAPARAGDPRVAPPSWPRAASPKPDPHHRGAQRPPAPTERPSRAAGAAGKHGTTARAPARPARPSPGWPPSTSGPRRRPALAAHQRRERRSARPRGRRSPAAGCRRKARRRPGALGQRCRWRRSRGAPTTTTALAPSPLAPGHPGGREQEGPALDRPSRPTRRRPRAPGAPPAGAATSASRSQWPARRRPRPPPTAGALAVGRPPVLVLQQVLEGVRVDVAYPAPTRSRAAGPPSWPSAPAPRAAPAIDCSSVREAGRVPRRSSVPPPAVGVRTMTPVAIRTQTHHDQGRRRRFSAP